ncbi:gamma-glutamyltransferase [Tahibacter amnicola]|uniref:Glutathione hydrolase proenzyme n=1 Tax=Tahibacter amnicola TaxID=2976241 RepID=A0ABY6B9B4_9GAMM|nr:gamma-glutamyltransferase [Tahibacter amnicola]UXI66142.1 gamma-glutamyltransferase [Tahibacter amnicola]
MIRTCVLAVLLAATHLPAAGAAELAHEPGRAAIASAHALATKAGMTVLNQGGNAFDAAVAVAATLSVVEPQSSGIGGGGLFLLHRASDNSDRMIDARETAPRATRPADFLDADGGLDQEKAWNGALAAAIPGEPAALVWIAKHYGKLPLKTSLAPAIRIARKGFVPDARMLDDIEERLEVIKRYPASAALFLQRGALPKPNWVHRNPDIARTLTLIADKGHDGFYGGELARTLVEGINAAGGNWTLQDLADYQVKEREPLVFQYREWRIVTAPPPSSGGIALKQMLNILAGYDLASLDRIHRVHLTVEAMRRAYRDRAEYLGDPDYITMPLEELGSPLYAAGLRASIHPERATPSDLLPGYTKAKEREHTSHFSIIDAEGNRVSATQTINLALGSALVIPGTGFVMNNEMDDFALKSGAPNAFGLVGADANAPHPGRRPLSSMSPSFLIGPDRIAVIGSPGGSTIITQVLEAMLAFIDGQLPAQIVANPRYHHQYLPDVIEMENDTFDAEEVQQLQAMGHSVIRRDKPWGFMNIVSWDRKSGQLHAGADKRRASGSAVVQ